MIYLDANGKYKTKSGKEVDFVFVYEAKVRELQSIVLIGNELVKKGYTVAYVNTWGELHRCNKKYTAKVASLFAAYNDGVIGFALGFIDKCKVAINMQWEQILNPQCLEEGSHFVLSGNANRIYHLAWGEKNVEHLTNRCKIPEKYVKKVGHVALDFAKEKYRGYYKSRDEICNEFGIDASKRIAIFTSSFPAQVTTGTLSTRTEEYLETAENSRKQIVEWIMKYHEEDPDIMFIYRPHPTEALSKEFTDFLQKDGYIKVIGDYSVQQWVVVSDIILNWWSTSLADIYAAKKSCLILRPVKMPVRNEYEVMQDADFVTSYDEFSKRMKDGISTFPISKEKFEKYYYFDEEDAYKKVVREFEYLYANEDNIDISDLCKPKAKVDYLRDLKNLIGYIRAKQKVREGKGDVSEYQAFVYQCDMGKKNKVSEKEIIKMMIKMNQTFKDE